MKKSFNVDVAVLFIFFTRTQISIQTFQQIKKARPSRLYLYQDGPRKGRNDDLKNIEECRTAIESMIDWDCEVFKFYQKENVGCDPSEYLSQKWMFSKEEKGIVIEDDDVMSVSFFRYCKELLDKYENDNRINIICGMNHLGVYEKCPNDYFFVRSGGSIWGWASWKRVVDEWDSQYSLISVPYVVKLLRDNAYSIKEFDDFLETCKNHHSSGREHYESILAWSCKLNSRYNIVPKYNMTKNIGIAEESTHSVSDISRLPRATRKIMNMKTYELSFPLSHPQYMISEEEYIRLFKKLYSGNWFVRTFKTRKIESLLYRLFPILGK